MCYNTRCVYAESFKQNTTKLSSVWDAQSLHHADVGWQRMMRPLQLGDSPFALIEAAQ